MSAVDISALSGVGPTQVRYLIHGRCENIHRVTDEAIRGIPVPENGWTPIIDGLADATGTRRRLQALSFHGFPLPVLAGEAETTERTVSELRGGLRSRVRVSCLRAVTLTHDRLWDTDPQALGVPSGSATRARRWAQSQGWYPTEAWADIDDPNCKPVLKTPKYVVLTENSQELYDQGYDSAMAAERLGVTQGTLRSARSHYTKVAMAE